MATYKIINATKSGDAPHDHVVSIDIGPTTTLTAAEVRDAIDRADVYYVYGDGESAVVEKFDCDCGAQTIRSEATATAANSLDKFTAS